jgi:hypothetical protein
MTRTYEAPRLVVEGTLMELTLANKFHLNADAIHNVGDNQSINTSGPCYPKYDPKPGSPDCI